MASGSRAKKRKRSASFSQPRSAPEEAFAEQSATLTRTDLLCPLCFDLFGEVYILHYPTLAYLSGLGLGSMCIWCVGCFDVLGLP